MGAFEFYHCYTHSDSRNLIPENKSDLATKFKNPSWTYSDYKTGKGRVSLILVIVLLTVSLFLNFTLSIITITNAHAHTDKGSDSECVVDAETTICRRCGEAGVFGGRLRANTSTRKRICRSTAAGGDVCCMAISRAERQLIDIVTLRDASRKTRNRDGTNTNAPVKGRQDKTKITERLSDNTHDTSEDMRSIGNAGQRPAAHFVLNVTALVAQPGSLTWTPDDQLGMASLQHIQYINHDIVISVPGLYYIYSFITFVSENSAGGGMFNHYIYRRNSTAVNEGWQLLLMDKQTKRLGNLEYQTSFLAGVFRLRRGDLVFSLVSDIHSVYKSAVSNYFGMFSL